jgi:hypothetical protein
MLVGFTSALHRLNLLKSQTPAPAVLDLFTQVRPPRSPRVTAA